MSGNYNPFVSTYPKANWQLQVLNAATPDDALAAYVKYAKAHQCESNMPEKVRDRLKELGLL